MPQIRVSTHDVGVGTDGRQVVVYEVAGQGVEEASDRKDEQQKLQRKFLLSTLVVMRADPEPQTGLEESCQ